MDDNNPSKDPKTIAALVNEGRFNYPYIPTGVYAEIRSLYGLQVMTQEALIRVKNRIARWLSIYFPEYKDVYRSCDANETMITNDRGRCDRENVHEYRACTGNKGQ